MTESPTRSTSTVARLAVTSRPLSWVNTAFPFAAAYLLATRHVDVALIVGGLYFLVPYNLALYGINDVFDYESDLLNPRKGGAEGALLEPRMHRVTLVAILVSNLPFLAALVALGGPLSWLVLAFSLFALIAYSAPPFRFKEKPILDSVTSSTHFVSPALYALVLAHATFTSQSIAVLLAFFLWGVASHAFGAVQDVVPDRSASINSIATVLGAHRTVRFAVVAWLLAGIVMLGAAWPGPLAAVLVLPYVAAAAPYWSISDSQSARSHRGWTSFLWLNYACGFLVTLLLITYAFDTR